MERVVAPGVVTIDADAVGPSRPTFLVAELGINHGGDVEVAKRLVEAAAQAGANAVKLQTYRTEERVPRDSPIYDVLKDAELDEAGHRELKLVAADSGVGLLSTPFDEESVALLSDLGVPAYKIASFDIVNLRLIQVVASQGKPVIISRGMAPLAESDRAAELVGASGSPLILLHCVSAYPLPPADANLAVMDTMRARYGCPVGFSDHTMGIDVPALAVARGADMIEKHFTLDRTAPGPDHALSAEPAEFAALCSRVRDVETILGSSEPRLLDAEAGTLPYRRPSEPR
ncbi:MAG: N-acetylneuraminate synthase family protein [Candidatus Limnocylindria bacterium]